MMTILVNLLLLSLYTLRVRADVQPVALWPLSDLYTNPAEDITGNGHNGISTNLVDGDHFASYKMNVKNFSNSSIVVANTNGELSFDNFAIMFWIKVDHASHQPIIMWSGNEAGPGFHIMTHINNNMYIRHTHVFDGNTLFPLYAPYNSMPPGRWHRLVVSYNNDTRAIFASLNGIGGVVSVAYLPQWTNIEGDIYIGKGQGQFNSDTYFEGQLTCVSLFDTYISQDSLINTPAISEQCFGYNCIAQRHVFSKANNQEGGGVVIIDLPCDSRLSCGIYCLQKCCRSFSFSVQLQKCILHKTVAPDQAVMPDSEWEFFTM